MAREGAIIAKPEKGSVTIDQSIERITVTGTCVDVVVSGSNSTVTMSTAATLTVTGANTDVVASGHVGDVEVAGGNSTVKAPSADDVTLSAGTAAAVFTGTVGRVELLEGNTRVKTGVADRVLVLYRGRVMGSCPTAGADRARIGAWMAGHREKEEEVAA